MAVIGGILGAVNGHASVRQWSIDVRGDIPEWASSASQGAYHASLGNTDWSGSFQAYGHTPVAMPGEALSFIGSIDGSVGASGTAIVDSVAITIDIEGKKPIEYTVGFSANGALTLGAAVATDATTGIAPPSVSSKVALGTVVAAPVWTDVDDCRSITLNFACENKEYVSSSTSSGKRRVKGNLKMSVSYSVYCASFATLPALNSISSLRAYVTASTYWEYNYLVFGEATGLLVNRETGDPVGATLNTKFRGVTLIGAAETVGSIKNPAGTTWWPAA